MALQLSRLLHGYIIFASLYWLSFLRLLEGITSTGRLVKPRAVSQESHSSARLGCSCSIHMPSRSRVTRRGAIITFVLSLAACGGSVGSNVLGSYSRYPGSNAIRTKMCFYSFTLYSGGHFVDWTETTTATLFRRMGQLRLSPYYLYVKLATLKILHNFAVK